MNDIFRQYQADLFANICRIKARQFYTFKRNDFCSPIVKGFKTAEQIFFCFSMTVSNKNITYIFIPTHLF